MALTYDTLQSTVADYLDRSDLDSVLPTFIELAESKFKRKLRHWKMEKRATADTVAGQRTLDLPTDFIEMRSLKLNTDPVRVLEYVVPAHLNWYDSSSGTPLYYSVIGGEIHFDDTPDSVYQVEMYYYAFDSLSDSVTTNWLIEDHPDLYLYGTLLEAESFLMNDPRLQVWKLAFDEALRDLNKSSKIAHAAGAPLIMRTA